MKTAARPMLPEVRCAHCHEPMTLHSCTYAPGPGDGMEKLPVQRMHRKRRATDDAPTIELVDLLGDRWTGLVVSVQYFGIHRFDEMQNMLGIASNILTDRLRTLETAGIFERRLYEITPPRYEYSADQEGAGPLPPCPDDAELGRGLAEGQGGRARAHPPQLRRGPEQRGRLQRLQGAAEDGRRAAEARQGPHDFLNRRPVTET
jgi:DNA-binding HxlR family transcriptional regulator